MHRLCQVHTQKEKPNGQSHGNRNIYSQSSYLLSQVQQSQLVPVKRVKQLMYRFKLPTFLATLSMF